MTRNDQLATVIRLACLSEDRSDQEQRALIALAWESDRAHNRNTVSNRGRWLPGWEPQDLVSHVLASRIFSGGERFVPPPKNWERVWALWRSEAA